MAPFRALYYPSWNPPVKWLRAMLLFFDQIQVIRPEDIRDPNYHDANKAVFDIIPEAFGEIRKQAYDMSSVPSNMQVLTSALDQINTRSTRSNRFEIIDLLIGPGGTIEIPGYAFLHYSKLNQSIYRELDKRFLILKKTKSIIGQVSDIGGFLIVERQACNLILALLADHYARQQGLRTITDMQLPYTLNALNIRPSAQRRAAATKLTSLIIRTEIPDGLENMTASQYVALRRRYDDLREPFQHAVSQICDDELLAEISDKKHFDTAVRNAATRFCYETERLRKKRWFKRVANWIPVGLGILSSYCSLAGGAMVALGFGTSAVLQIYQGIRENQFVTEKRRAQQLLGDVGDELVHPVLFRRIRLPRRNT